MAQTADSAVFVRPETRGLVCANSASLGERVGETHQQSYQVSFFHQPRNSSLFQPSLIQSVEMIRTSCLSLRSPIGHVGLVFKNSMLNGAPYKFVY